ncbi:MAG TPA: penicillin acylase family protein, partial [Nevskiaceae bacterium]|nr:penicillin acylase family protein [Nevskiaceae bacterium]
MRNHPWPALALLLLAGCGGGDGDGGQPGNGGGGAPPSTLSLKAENVLPPGQSGFISLAGQVQGTLTGNPGDYGAHVDDQRQMYWSFSAKPGVLGTKPGAVTHPLARVDVYRDDAGVPIVYAANVHDLWFGVGYSVAQDRLFLMDAVRRMGAGTFGELTGCGGVPADIQQRTLAYTDAEYQSFYDALSPDARDAVQGYVDGANAWRAAVMTDPTQLPAEYALLTTTPAAFTVKDVLAGGVYITRFVAAEGGNEFLNIEMIKQLQAAYGSADAGLAAFQDMTWLEDPKAVVTVPRSEGTFSNQAEPVAGRDAVFNSMATWALGLPETLWKGPGTGNSTVPAPCSQPSLPGPLGSAGGLGAGEVKFAAAPAPSKKGARRAAQIAELQRGVVRALAQLRASLHGGSHAYAIAPSRTRDHGTLLVSGPQLGYTYPTLLVEYEIHGGGYDARGVSVPILPVVGIGYSNDIAWGLTTGYSKTIDSFIETTCSTEQQAASACKANQYFHQGVWKDMDCRGETFNYRAATQGVPVGPAVLSTTAQICRTVHGPIVARDDAAGFARSVQYAMYLHEIDNIEGIRLWNRAHTFADFLDGARHLTWNENVVAATRDGHIAYIHPGRFPQRSPDTDMRLPAPGTGQYDMGPMMAFEQLPHVFDPAQGFVANWNNKPAYGWLDGEGMGATSRPGGAGQRVTTIMDAISARRDWRYDDLMALDTHVGTTDHRAREYLPVLASFRSASAASLSDVQRAALDLMLSWNGSHYGPNIDLSDASAHDAPAPTIFGEYVIALRDELFASLKNRIIDPGVQDPDPNNPDPQAGLT